MVPNRADGYYESNELMLSLSLVILQLLSPYTNIAYIYICIYIHVTHTFMYIYMIINIYIYIERERERDKLCTSIISTNASGSAGRVQPEQAPRHRLNGYPVGSSQRGVW